MKDVLLIHISGQHYAVWSDEIASMQEMQNLHRLPLTPACIAGIAMIDDHTVTLADLLVCMGGSGASDTGNRKILMPSAADKTMGFMIDGDTQSLSLPPDHVLPMPDYLRTDLVSSCLVLNGVLIPIISLSLLYQQLLIPGQEAFRPSFSLPARGHTSTPSRAMLFRIDGELFAVLTTALDHGTVEPGQVTELAQVPLFVKGIALHEGQALPVIDLGQRIKRRRTARAGRMVIHRIGSASFGLLVEQVQTFIPRSDAVLAELPPLAGSSWLSSALLWDGEIVPLVDLESMIAADTAEGRKRMDELYSPDSQFPAFVMTQPVTVVEFSLLGARHAVPRSEVEDIVPFRTIRTVPDVPEIVLGVTEHNGSLLPVLDLAAVFGRRSLVSPSWSMLLVTNGDFRAFVLTEAVYGERSLPVELQRALPIVLPHRVVYACYPDAEAVRLILNVHSIAVHFEKSLVQELLPALSSEMRNASAELVSFLLDAEAETTGLSSDTASFAGPSQTAESELRAAGSGVLSSEREAEEIGQGTDEAASQREEPEQVAPLPRVSLEQEDLSPLGPEAAAPEPSVERAPGDGVGVPAGETATDETLRVSAEAASEKMLPPADTLPERTISAPAEAAAEALREEKEGEPAAAALQTTDETAPPSADEQLRSVPSPESEPEREPLPEPDPAARSRPESGPERAHAPENEKPKQDEEFGPINGSGSRPVASVIVDEIVKRPARSRRLWLKYAAIAAVLAAIVTASTTIRPIWNPKQVRETGASKAEPDRTQAGIRLSVKELQAKQPSTVRPSLVLEIPAERHFETDVYVVVKDDTLWSISARFTGDPFKYPKIAGENRIADPDLIFPGQKIRLQQKK